MRNRKLPACLIERPRIVLPAATSWSHNGLSALDRGQAACREAIAKVKDLSRTAVDDRLGEVVRAVRDGTAAAHRAGRSLAAACRAAGRAERNLAAANRAALQASDVLGHGLQDARRDVARALELMRPARPVARTREELWSEPLRPYRHGARGDAVRALPVLYVPPSCSVLESTGRGRVGIYEVRKTRYYRCIGGESSR